VPLHFTAFHPDFKMTDVPHTPAETCRRAREQAKGFGLRHVYSGNIHDSDGQSTYCPSCGERVIERDWYSLGAYRLDGNQCATCGTVVPGVFPAGGPGTWGPKRKRIFIA
jgi:pyruvate formate lyase activating enzyme